MSDVSDPHPVDEDPEQHIGDKVADPWIEDVDGDAGEPVTEISDGSDRVGPGGVSYVREN